MSSNTNIGNTPVNQGYVQLIHMGETGGIDGTLRALYDGDGTASDLLIASDKVKISTELYIGSKTLTEFVQDTVGAMFSSNTETNITVTYQDGDGTIDLVSSGEVTLTGSETLTNKTLTSPVINTGVSGSAILDEDNMASNSATKLSTQQSIKAYVDAEVAGIVDSAPSTLNTLHELATALGDDANFSTTVTNSIATKASLTGTETLTNKTLTSPTFTGDIDFSDASTPQLNITDTTNTITTRVASSNTNGIVGTVTDHNFNIQRNSVGHFSLFGLYTMHNNGGADIDFRVKDNSGNVVFKVDAGDSKTHITTLDVSGDADIDGTLETDALTIGGVTSVPFEAADHSKLDGIASGATANIGDITGVDLTSGAGITISSETNTTSGAYSSTIATNIASTSLNVSGTGQLAINLNKSALSTATLNASDFMILFDANDSEAPKRFVAQDIFDSLGGITIDGTTANGLLTYGGTNNIDTESGLTYDGTYLSISGTGGTDGAAGSPIIRLNNTTQSADWDTGDVVGTLEYYAEDASGNAPYVTSFIKSVNGADGSNGTLPSGALTFGVASYNLSGGAVEKMRIDSTGKVGIGTGSPGYKLDISSGDINLSQSQGIRINGYYRLYGDGNYTTLRKPDGGIGLYLGLSDAANYYDNTRHRFRPSGGGSNYYMTVSTGGLGISRGTDDAEAKLHIGDSDNDNNALASNVLGTTSGNSIDYIKLECDSTNANQLIFSSERVADGSDWTTTRERIRRKIDGSDMGYIQFGSAFGSNEMVGIGRTGVGTALSVDGNLRVGIGTLTPDTKLEVTGSTNTDLFSLEGAGSSFKLIAESGSTGSSDIMAYRLGLRYGSNDNGFIDFYRGPDGATGYLTFGASGSEVMRLDRYGNVGIGTTSPSKKFVVKGASGDQARFEHNGAVGSVDIYSGTDGGLLNVRNASGTSIIELDGRSGNLELPYGRITDAGTDMNIVSDNALTLGTESGTALTIPNASTNVGIGTVSPSTKMHIKDASNNVDLRIETDKADGMAQVQYLNDARQYNVGINNVDAWGVYDATASATRLTINSSGNVGIGATTIDDGNLQIGDANSAFNIAIAGPRTKFGYDGSNAIVQGGTAKGIAFCVNNTTLGSGEAMRINSSGLVGIGTTSPATNLHISSGSAQTDSDGMLKVEQTSTSSGSAATNAGINTKNYHGTSQFLQWEEHGLRIGSRILTNSGTGDVVFTAGADSEKMRIKADGSVGIGTASPGVKLDVAGQARTTNGMLVNNGTTAGFFTTDSDNVNFGSSTSGKGLKIFSANTERLRIVSGGDAHFDQDVIAFSTTPSDIRLKKNFTKIDNGLDVVNKLEGHTFNWKKGGDRLSAGFKAQEVEKILPHLVDEKKLPLKADDDKEYKILRYEEMIPYLVEAIKEQQDQINELKGIING